MIARERVLVMNQTRESVLSVGADVADGFIGRCLGLAPGTHMRPGGGLWVNAARVLHTVGVTFPVDVVCLDPANEVVEIEEDFRPFHVRMLGDHISSFLELPVHTVVDSKTEIGDMVTISPSEPMQQVQALYTNGGPVEYHAVKSVTKKGAVVETDDRWYPGTIVDMTLRYDEQFAKLSKMEREANDSVHVRAKVVAPSEKGVQVEFVFLKRPEKREYKRFIRRI
jgi:uncharacterized membrane protein (UPF0127 family)